MYYPVEHTYPSFISIQVTINERLNFSAEEELLHLFYIGQLDKMKAQKMLQEWFPKEKFSPIT
jgi:hypothetical protein